MVAPSCCPVRYATRRGGSAAAAGPTEPSVEGEEAEGEVPESERFASYGEGQPHGTTPT